MAPPSDTLHLCTFVVGDETYAVDVMRVVEIAQPERSTPIPGAPDFVAGVVDLHGSMVPIIDLRRRFGLVPAANTKKTKHLFCRVAHKRVGLVVDAMKGNLRVPRASVKSASDVAGDGVGHFAGMVSTASGIVLLLNIRALLDSNDVGVRRAQTSEQR